MTPDYIGALHQKRAVLVNRKKSLELDFKRNCLEIEGQIAEVDNAPELPYFTLNINEKDLSVIQNHGRGNCSAPTEVDAFVKLFMAWARAGCKRDKDGRPVMPKKRKAKVPA